MSIGRHTATGIYRWKLEISGCSIVLKGSGGECNWEDMNSNAACDFCKLFSFFPFLLCFFSRPWM